MNRKGKNVSALARGREKRNDREGGERKNQSDGRGSLTLSVSGLSLSLFFFILASNPCAFQLISAQIETKFNFLAESLKEKVESLLLSMVSWDLLVLLCVCVEQMGEKDQRCESQVH